MSKYTITNNFSVKFFYQNAIINAADGYSLFKVKCVYVRNTAEMDKKDYKDIFG